MTDGEGRRTSRKGRDGRGGESLGESEDRTGPRGCLRLSSSTSMSLGTGTGVEVVNGDRERLPGVGGGGENGDGAGGELKSLRTVGGTISQSLGKDEEVFSLGDLYANNLFA